MAPLFLLIKSQIAGYTRKDGTYVKPHTDKRRKAAEAAGQGDLFRPARPARAEGEAPRPNPYKGKDPDLDVPDLFTGKTRREEETRAPRVTSFAPDRRRSGTRPAALSSSVGTPYCA